MKLTPAERNAIRTLQRLAKRWPKTLWIYAGSNDLMVMRLNKKGKRAMDGDAVDQNYCVADIAIPSDGGGF